MDEKLSPSEARRQAIIEELQCEIATLVQKLHEASLDDLTGLTKRKELNEAIRNALKKGHLPASVLFLDINGLKEINDSQGHDAGDSLLMKFAEFLKDFKEGMGANGRLAVLSRLGGDEFVILLPFTENDAAIQLARDLKQLLSDADFTIGDRRIEVHSAIGVATTGRECSTAVDLLRAADIAMYADKKSMTNSGETTRQVSVSQ